ncbi:MAG: trigger factor, partial [Anaeroplasmataceae bacterium]
MKIEVLNQSRQKATFDVSVEDFKNAVDQAFPVVNENVTIKGFRKGKATRAQYDKHYGVETLYDEAFNILLNQKVKELLEEKELAKKIISQFTPDLVDFKPDTPFQITLSFDIQPEFNLPQYKGLEVDKVNLVASDDEINAKLEELQKTKAVISVKDTQVLNNGDIAVFDFAGSVDGVAFEGGTAENYELKIGSGQFIPGFEEQMVGMKKEEVKDVNVKFPEEYQAEHLAGKDAVFKVTLHEVKEEKLPELTDDFVKSLELENISTVKELKASKKAEIESTKEKTEKDRQVDTLINKILDNAVVDVPQSLVNERVEQVKN